MAASHKTLQALILGHFVSVRRSGDFGLVRKIANWGEACEDLSVKKKMCVVECAQDDAYGTGAG